MSITGKRLISIPTLLLFDAIGHWVVVETNDGCYIRGVMEYIELSWNVHLSDVTYRNKNKEFKLKRLVIRGSQVCGIILPDIYLLSC